MFFTGTATCLVVSIFQCSLYFPVRRRDLRVLSLRRPGIKKLLDQERAIHARTHDIECCQTPSCSDTYHLSHIPDTPTADSPLSSLSGSDSGCGSKSGCSKDDEYHVSAKHPRPNLDLYDIARTHISSRHWLVNLVILLDKMKLTLLNLSFAYSGCVSQETPCCARREIDTHPDIVPNHCLCYPCTTSASAKQCPRTIAELECRRLNLRFWNPNVKL